MIPYFPSSPAGINEKLELPIATIVYTIISPLFEGIQYKGRKEF